MFQVKSFFRTTDVGSGTRSLEQSLETMKLNINWVKQNEEALLQWLMNYLER